MKLTDAEWTVSGVIAKEFAKTGEVDCPRLAKLICKALRLRHGFKNASVQHTNYSRCKHPDHSEAGDCLDRAVGCSPHCLCCMGELAIPITTTTTTTHGKY